MKLLEFLMEPYGVILFRADTKQNQVNRIKIRMLMAICFLYALLWEQHQMFHWRVGTVYHN